jgi:hypothetical protein
MLFVRVMDAQYPWLICFAFRKWRTKGRAAVLLEKDERKSK